MLVTSIHDLSPVRDDWLQDESVWGPTLIPIQDDDWSVTVRVALGHPGGWRCDCWNTTEDGRHLETECRCTGLTLQDVPHTLIKPLHSLYIQDIPFLFSVWFLASCKRAIPRVSRSDGLSPRYLLGTALAAGSVTIQTAARKQEGVGRNSHITVTNSPPLTPEKRESVYQIQ
uniref:Uncharacterized protein n=1 Tax=Timema monikensis TaxID=170555 RepID=A0A7R9ECU0_9NEOP|nr:unnamed protein product [Timema monikensis]